MASSFTRNQIVAFILASRICFALFLFGKIAQILPQSLQPVIAFLRHRLPLRELQPRGDRHPRRALLPVGHRGLPDGRHRLPRKPKVEVTPWLTTAKKKRTYASNALLYALFAVGALVLVNLLSTRVFGRLDLTEHDVYTLSQPSKDLVKKLPDYMTVKAFMSKDLPPELKAVSRYVRDLIDEYKTNSGGKFRWEAIDPGTDKKLEEEANRCKVQKLQIQVLRNQKFEMGQYYMGLCLEYGSQVESIPQVARAEGLEYQISSLIKKMTTKKKKIAFTNGHGEADTNQGFQALKGDLEQEFEITTRQPLAGRDRRGRRRPGGGRPQAGLRREGSCGRSTSS